MEEEEGGAVGHRQLGELLCRPHPIHSFHMSHDKIMNISETGKGIMTKRASQKPSNSHTIHLAYLVSKTRAPAVNRCISPHHPRAITAGIRFLVFSRASAGGAQCQSVRWKAAACLKRFQMEDRPVVARERLALASCVVSLVGFAS